MAYMNQVKKKLLAPGIQAVLKKYGVKASIAVRHHSTLIVNIKSGDIDFRNSVNTVKVNTLGDTNVFHSQVNLYWIEDNWTGTAAAFLIDLKAAMNGCGEIQNHDRSDIMTDYFDVGWYKDVNIGQWDKDYVYTGG